MASLNDMVAVAKNAVASGQTNFEQSDFVAALNQRAASIGRSVSWAVDHDDVSKLLVRAAQYASDNVAKSYLTGQVPTVASLKPEIVSGASAFRVNEAVDALAALNRIVDRQCQLNPGKSRDRVFSDVYSSHSELARLEREQNRPSATIVSKFADGEVPRFADNSDIEKPEDSEDAEREDKDPGLEALAELDRKADEIRQRNPGLSKAQSFAKAYAQNPSLAAAERRAHRPVPTRHSKYEDRS
jgi:hypothetical protein